MLVVYIVVNVALSVLLNHQLYAAGIDRLTLSNMRTPGGMRIITMCR